MKCLKCGTDNSSDAQFCRACGSKLDTVESTFAAPLQPGNAAIPSLTSKGGINKAVVAGIVAAVLLATGGAGGYWYYQKQETEKIIAAVKHREEEAKVSAEAQSKAEAERAKAETAALSGDFEKAREWEKKSIALGSPAEYGLLLEFFGVSYPDWEFQKTIEGLVKTEEQVRSAHVLRRCNVGVIRSPDRFVDQSYMDIVRKTAAIISKENDRPGWPGDSALAVDQYLAAAVLAYSRADATRRTTWRAYLQTKEAKEGFKWTGTMDIVFDYLYENSSIFDFNTGKIVASRPTWLWEFLTKASLVEEFVKAADESRSGLGQDFKRLATMKVTPDTVPTHRMLLDEVFPKIIAAREEIVGRMWKMLPRPAGESAAHWAKNPMTQEIVSSRGLILGGVGGLRQNGSYPSDTQTAAYLRAIDYKHRSEEQSVKNLKLALSNVAAQCTN